MSKARNSVLVAPAIGSRAARRSHAIEGELTLAQIVEATLPGLPKEAWPEVHLTLVSDRGAAVIPSHLWHLVRPNEGVRVVIVVRPGLTALGSVLISVLTAQAASIGAAYLGTWAGLAGASQLVLGAISGLAYFAGQTAGNLLRNALFGNAGTSDDGERRNSYLISGWQNESRPGQRLP